MKTRVQQNMVWQTKKIVWGVSIMIEGSRMYCKYPIGHQDYKSKEEAEKARADIQILLDDGAKIEYASGNTKGLNKSEYVDLKVQTL